LVVKFVQSELYQPVYSASAFTFPLMPVTTNENPTQVILLNWGLIPYWTKYNETAQRIKQLALNARSETIFEKPIFRQSILSKRCLVVVDGFFEWKHLNNKSYPYYITLADHRPFALAGIWDKWQNLDTGIEAQTFSVITTEANPLMAQIHNTKKRMPAILSMDNEKKWIDNNLKKTDIEALPKHCNEGEMVAYPVDRSISRLGFNTS
jgi:putative SOS response-associated peptidase YedK